MDEKRYFVIQNKDGKYFKIDNSTGGYPMFTDDFEFCERYKTEEDVNKFLGSNYVINQFRKEFDNATISEVAIKVICRKGKKQ